jgi:hypothetical protein
MIVAEAVEGIELEGQHPGKVSMLKAEMDRDLAEISPTLKAFINSLRLKAGKTRVDP